MVKPFEHEGPPERIELAERGDDRARGDERRVVASRDGQTVDARGTRQRHRSRLAFLADERKLEPAGKGSRP
jgi:hypothetical protein